MSDKKIDCPICKARKIAVLEGWYAFEKILFKDNKKSKLFDETTLKEFKELKGCFLTNIFEIYKETNFTSKNQYKDKNELIEKTFIRADNVINESKNIIKQKEFKRRWNMGTGVRRLKF